MNTVPHPVRPVALSVGDEALELRDVGSREMPAQDADAFPADEVDEQYVADMQAREACRAGYVGALCLGCGVALFIPEHERCSDVLCAQCRRVGNTHC